VKDAFHRHIVNGESGVLNDANVGTKAALHYQFDDIPAGQPVVVRLRLSPEAKSGTLDEVDAIIALRRSEADQFYDNIHPREATADEKTINAYRNSLKDDELVVVMGKVQPDRFSGGLRLVINQVWDLAQARCRFGKYLSVTVNGTAPDVSRLLRDHPAKVETSEQGDLVRGLGVRFKLLRDGATADLDLGESSKFFPSDTALASWMAQAYEGQSQIIYE
jgi:hypothetical protein